MAAGTGLLREKQFTPVLDTGIYAAGDVLFPTIEVTDFFRVQRDQSEGANVALNSIQMYDADDEAALEVDLIFFRSSVSVGAANDPFAGISDTELLEVIGVATIDSATDTVFDFINNRYYQKEGLAIQMQGLAGSKSVFVSGINRTNTPTFATASDLTFRLGVTQD